MSNLPHLTRLGGDFAPRVLGDVLLTAIAHLHRGESDGSETAITAQALAERLGMSPSSANTALRTLTLARCLRTNLPHSADKPSRRRRAPAYSLPPVHEERGAGRHARLFPVGLLVAPEEQTLAQHGRLMQQVDILPLGVTSTAAARMILRQLGVEFVVVVYSINRSGMSATEVQVLHWDAQQAGCGRFLVANADQRLLTRLNADAGAPPLAEVLYPESLRPARNAM